MKTTIMTIIVIIFIVGISYAENQFDLRELNWGMNRNDVLASEKAQKSFVIEIFPENISSDFKCLNSIDIDQYVLMFGFDEKKLVSVSLWFNRKEGLEVFLHLPGQKYYETYNKLLKALTGKYGNPIRVDEVWDKEIGDFNKEDKVKAIEKGILTIKAHFQNERTYILLNLETHKPKTIVENEGTFYLTVNYEEIVYHNKLDKLRSKKTDYNELKSKL